MRVQLFPVHHDGLWQAHLVNDDGSSVPGIGMHEFQAHGGLYTALDIASAFALGRCEVGASLRWEYRPGLDYYTAEVPK